MNKIEFQEIISQVMSSLDNKSKNTPELFSNCQRGEDFEKIVYDILSEIITTKPSPVTLEYSKGSHAFPDIVLIGEHGYKFGIEVKASTSGKLKTWRINGNSVMGSTRVPGLEEVYIIFGKTHKNFLEFKAKSYENSVSNVAVTHSPRYLIDMDLNPSETFFEKSGIPYQELIDSDNPIQMITSYFLSKGERAWWLSESTPATIRIFNELTKSEQEEYVGYGLAHFPELFSSDQKKFYRFAAWLATEHSIVSYNLRDFFTAGGKVDIPLEKETLVRLPRIFEKLVTHKTTIIDALDIAEPSELVSAWNYSDKLNDKLDEKVAVWKCLVLKNSSDLGKNSEKEYFEASIKKILGTSYILK